MTKFIVLLLESILLVLSVSCTNKSTDSFEDNVVVVNEHQLSGIEFSKKLVRRFIEQEIKYPKPEIINVLKKQIVEDFIIQSVFDDYAKKENILVKKEIMDEAFNKFKDGYPDQDSFDIFLNESGLNRATFRESLKAQLIRDLVSQKLLATQNFEITPQLINEYYNNNKDEFKQEDQIRLKQIIFETEEEGTRIEELLKKTGSKNFENLAMKYSLGPEKKDGGDLGWVNVNSYSAFEEAAKSSIGQITSVIKSENGLHIFKVVDKRKSKMPSIKEVEPEIKKILLKSKQTEFMNDWIKTQVAASNVKINEELLSRISVNRPTSL